MAGQNNPEHIAKWRQSYTGKPTRDRYNVLVKLCVEMLISGTYTMREMRDAFRKFVGPENFRPTTFRRYLARARKELEESGELKLEDERARAFRRYHKWISDPAVPVHTKILAQKALDRITGIRAPQQHEVLAGFSIDSRLQRLLADPGGLRELERLLARFEPAIAGNADNVVRVRELGGPGVDGRESFDVPCGSDTADADGQDEEEPAADRTSAGTRKVDARE